MKNANDREPEWLAMWLRRHLSFFEGGELFLIWNISTVFTLEYDCTF